MYPVLPPSHRIGSLFTFTDLYQVASTFPKNRSTVTPTPTAHIPRDMVFLLIRRAQYVPRIYYKGWKYNVPGSY